MVCCVCHRPFQISIFNLQLSTLTRKFLLQRFESSLVQMGDVLDQRPIQAVSQHSLDHGDFFQFQALLSLLNTLLDAFLQAFAVLFA